MKIKGLEIVEKRNVLNEIKKNDMTLQELRFFSIYLAKINSRNISTRVVKFKLEKFQKIMNLGRLNIKNFEDVTNRLLCKIIRVPRKNGEQGYDKFQLFEKCSVYKDENDYNQWYVEINAHDDALPLMFEFKEKYFTYALWNALRLTSRNQLRMYELLKQYEPIGMREIKLDKLKDWLGIDQDEYSMFNKFKIRVLDACQKALLENTDIKYDYELMKTERRVSGVRFIIKKNEDYKDPLKLKEYVNSISDYEKKLVSLSNRKQVSRRRKNKHEGFFELGENASFTMEDIYAKIEN